MRKGGGGSVAVSYQGKGVDIREGVDIGGGGGRANEEWG